MSESEYEKARNAAAPRGGGMREYLHEGFIWGADWSRDYWKKIHAKELNEMVDISFRKAEEEMRKKAEKLVEALEFYADKENWSDSYIDIQDPAVICEDIGGTIARQALKEWNEQD